MRRLREALRAYDWRTDVLVVGGLALVLVAVWQVYPPAAVFVLGAVLLGVGVLRLR